MCEGTRKAIESYKVHVGIGTLLFFPVPVRLPLPMPPVHSAYVCAVLPGVLNIPPLKNLHCFPWLSVLLIVSARRRAKLTRLLL